MPQTGPTLSSTVCSSSYHLFGVSDELWPSLCMCVSWTPSAPELLAGISVLSQATAKFHFKGFGSRLNRHLLCQSLKDKTLASLQLSVNKWDASRSSPRQSDFSRSTTNEVVAAYCVQWYKSRKLLTLGLAFKKGLVWHLDQILRSNLVFFHVVLGISTGSNWNICTLSKALSYYHPILSCVIKSVFFICAHNRIKIFSIVRKK